MEFVFDVKALTDLHFVEEPQMALERASCCDPKSEIQ